MEYKSNGADLPPQQPQPQQPIPSTGYAGPPPYYAAPPVNYAPYPAPMMQPMQYAPPPPQQQQQQQQQTVVVNTAAAAPVIVQQATYDSYCGMQTLGCFVLWCCLSPFGLVGWILALYADSRKVSDPNGARNCGYASLGVSIAGIVVAIIIGGSLIGALRSPSPSFCSTGLVVNGVCYSSRRYVGNSLSCRNTQSSCCYILEDFYSNNYCYTR